MDIKKRQGQPNSQGNAAAEYSDFVARAGSWQYGKDSRFNDVVSESREEDLKYGVPNTNTDSTADVEQYGLRGPEELPVTIVTKETK